MPVRRTVLGRERTLRSLSLVGLPAREAAAGRPPGDRTPPTPRAEVSA